MPRDRLAAILLVALAACTGGSGRGEHTSPEAPMARSIEEVQDAYTQEWMDLSGVVGTGIALCDGRPCIKVFVSGPVEPLRDLIPDEVEGYPVVLEATGRFQARDSGGEA